jgi:hypothetical protein
MVNGKIRIAAENPPIAQPPAIGYITGDRSNQHP